MKAETAINVFNALSENEKERFYTMIGSVNAKTIKPKKLNDQATTEWLIRKIKK